MPGRKFAKTVLLLGVGLEALILIQFAGYPYWPKQLLLPSDAEVALFTILIPLSPLFLIVLLYERPIIALVRMAARRSLGFKRGLSYLAQPFTPLLPRIRFFDLAKSAGAIRLLDFPRALLAVGILASSFIASLAYWPRWNNSGSLSGVDSRLYQQWFGDMRSMSLNEAISYAFSQPEFGSRALLLVPFHLIGQLVGADPRQIVMALPFVLGPLLALATFQFGRSAGNGEHVAGLASLLTAFSFNITVGIWGAYYANWLALTESYLFLSVLLSFQRQISFSKYAFLTILSLFVLLTHPWTWVLVLTVSLVFSISFGRKKWKVPHAVYVILIIIIGVGADFLKNAIFGPRTIAQDLATKAPIAGFQELAISWPNIIDSLLHFNGGLMANAAILFVAAAGVLALKWKEPFQRLLIVWVVMAGAAIPFFNSYHQSRIIYDMPFPLLSAVGLTFLASRKEGRPVWSRLVILLGVLLTASYVLWTYFVS